MKMKIKQTGLTILEILTAAVIISILVMIVMPNFISSQNRAKNSAAKTNARTLRVMLETYFVDHKIYPEKLTTLGYEATTKKYNKKVGNPYTTQEGIVESGKWAVMYLGPNGGPPGTVAYQPISSNSKYYLFVYNERGDLLQEKGKAFTMTNG